MLAIPNIVPIDQGRIEVRVEKGWRLAKEYLNPMLTIFLNSDHYLWISSYRDQSLNLLRFVACLPNYMLSYFIRSQIATQEFGSASFTAFSFSYMFESQDFSSYLPAPLLTLQVLQIFL